MKYVQIQGVSNVAFLVKYPFTFVQLNLEEGWKNIFLARQSLPCPIKQYLTKIYYIEMCMPGQFVFTINYLPNKLWHKSSYSIRNNLIKLHILYSRCMNRIKYFYTINWYLRNLTHLDKYTIPKIYIEQKILFFLKFLCGARNIG